jgi:hypothetical protein
MSTNDEGHPAPAAPSSAAFADWFVKHKFPALQAQAHKQSAADGHERRKAINRGHPAANRGSIIVLRGSTSDQWPRQLSAHVRRQATQLGVQK